SRRFRPRCAPPSLTRDRWSLFSTRVEQRHRWVAERAKELDTPLLVCEPVLAESIHLLARFARAQEALFGLLDNGALKIAFHIDEHVPALRKLHQKYRDRPMSLAHACIARMAEIYDRHLVLTLFGFLGLSQTWEHPARAH